MSGLFSFSLNAINDPDAHSEVSVSAILARVDKILVGVDCELGLILNVWRSALLLLQIMDYFVCIL